MQIKSMALCACVGSGPSKMALTYTVGALIVIKMFNESNTLQVAKIYYIANSILFILYYIVYVCLLYMPLFVCEANMHTTVSYQTW